MDKSISELKSICKKKNNQRCLDYKDFQVVWYLWNDGSVSRNSIVEEVHRSEKTLKKIDKFIKEYIKKNKIIDVSDEILKKIFNEYTN